MTERFAAGIIGSPFGLKGFVKVKPLSGEVEHLLKLRSAAVRRGGKEQILKIAESLPQPPVVLMRFEGFDSPEAAKALSGGELLVDRSQASPLQDGEFYIEDLKGLAVVAAETGVCAAGGETLGCIADVLEGGGGELVEIQLSGGGVCLVPFRREFFAEISPEKGRVLLRNLWILEQ